MSWCAETNAELELEPELALFLVGDPATSRALVRLGSVYQQVGLHTLNGSPLALALLTPLRGRFSAWGETNENELAGVVQTLEEECERLAPGELRQAAALARHGALRLEHIALDRGPPLEELRRDLSALIEEQARVWRLRSRPGGLKASLARLAVD